MNCKIWNFMTYIKRINDRVMFFRDALTGYFKVRLALYWRARRMIEKWTHAKLELMLEEINPLGKDYQSCLYLHYGSMKLLQAQCWFWTALYHKT
jgi:hypothetical protein